MVTCGSRLNSFGRYFSAVNRFLIAESTGHFVSSSDFSRPMGYHSRNLSEFPLKIPCISLRTRSLIAELRDSVLERRRAGEGILSVRRIKFCWAFQWSFSGIRRERRRRILHCIPLDHQISSIFLFVLASPNHSSFPYRIPTPKWRNFPSFSFLSSAKEKPGFYPTPVSNPITTSG